MILIQAILTINRILKIIILSLAPHQTALHRIIFRQKQLPPILAKLVSRLHPRRHLQSKKRRRLRLAFGSLVGLVWLVLLLASTSSYALCKFFGDP